MSQELEKIAKREVSRAILAYDTERTLRTVSLKKRKAPSVLVLGRDGFSDNSKYLYLALVARSLGFPVIWGTFNSTLHQELTRRNLPVLNLGDSPSHVVSILMEISCVVYCTNPKEATGNSFYRAALAGAHKFQLWHGIGLKQLDLQNTGTTNLLNLDSLSLLAGVVDIDEVMSPSSLYDSQWREAFGVERVFRAGFPRNEVLLREASNHELLNSPSIPEAIRDRGFLLYAPTYARQGLEPMWRDSGSLALLAEFARRVGLGLVLKPHPFDGDPPASEAMRLPPTTLLLSAEADVYPILKYARALVTDVSSMASDFLLCDKPILFFRSQALEQQSYPIKYMPELPGRHVREESPEAFVRAWESIEETAGARARLRQLYFETDPLRACDELIERITEIVGKT
jgi:CDP-glycerol glycerophosphotransferase